MQDDGQTIFNPFPAEAVATFGKSYSTCTSLRYMFTVQDELNQYLTAHARPDVRYGGAIGLRGGHGSGKTHVLAWLGGTMQGARTIRGNVLYGKCDSSSFFDLHRQLMEQLRRPQLIELIELAFLNLARIKVGSAQVTGSLVDRLQTAGALQILQAEQNLDLEELRQQLLKELDTGSTASNEAIRILLEVPSSNVGDAAYRWLTAYDVDNLEVLGVTHTLGGAPRDAIADAETNAISVLEAIALLHRIAGVPLLVLVDQLEVLLRTPDIASFITLGSVLKKFIEQLTGQSAMIFIAGLPEAWDRLPRDVPARFRRREQITVGELLLAETRLRISAYMSVSVTIKSFTEPALQTIRQLSGGSPREILRVRPESVMLDYSTF